MTMSNIFSKIVIFSLGAVAGAAVTYKITKEKIMQEAHEEIDAIREYYNFNDSVDEDEEPSEPDENPKTDRAVYEEIVKDYKEEEEMEDRPYVIAPEEFGECDYATISLTYYADGIVANEKNKPIRNVDELIGEESLDHFGEYEEDSVFVRNDKLRIDYEILKDYREYSEIS